MQLVCPQKAGSIGCGIYWTGTDVTALFSKSKSSSGRRLQSTRKMLDCDSGAGVGESWLV